ncbi:Peptide methionine sulfoxide reductase MsrA [Diplonema papillatum]|nr:Peptide methionine sulfoxide reductase MsrA [Diplonema papillatum]
MTPEMRIFTAIAPFVCLIMWLDWRALHTVDADEPRRANEARSLRALLLAKRGFDAATFGGAGCVYCLQEVFDGHPGVVETAVGYSGDGPAHPTYQTARDDGSFVLALRVFFNATLVSYASLARLYATTVDPTASESCSVTAYDYTNATAGRPLAPPFPAARPPTLFLPSNRFQADAARALAAAVEAAFAPVPVAIDVRAPRRFYVAEEYHQFVYVKNGTVLAEYKAQCDPTEKARAVWEGKSLVFPAPS